MTQALCGALLDEPEFNGFGDESPLAVLHGFINLLDLATNQVRGSLSTLNDVATCSWVMILRLSARALTACIHGSSFPSS